VIVLDTNVISEFVALNPDGNVTDWLDAQDGDDVYLTAVTVGELRAGVALLPTGKRKAMLSAEIEAYVEDVFLDRILSFDMGCTLQYAEVHRARTRRGRPVTDLDAQIAAIALTYGATLATRNTKDFDGLGLELVNPWEAG